MATFVDETGEMELVWFQGHKWIRESLKLNIPYVIFGKVTSFNGQYNMAHPEMELLNEHEQNLRSALQPVYPSTETLTNRGIYNRVVNKMMQQLFLETQAKFTETLPQYLLDELKLIPKNSVITPHPKEFARLFGKTENSFERLKLAKEKATELEIYIILKDHHTQIITPEGNVFYNLTGNSGIYLQI